MKLTFDGRNMHNMILIIKFGGGKLGDQRIDVRNVNMVRECRLDSMAKDEVQ